MSVNKNATHIKNSPYEPIVRDFAARLRKPKETDSVDDSTAQTPGVPQPTGLARLDEDTLNKYVQNWKTKLQFDADLVEVNFERKLSKPRFDELEKTTEEIRNPSYATKLGHARIEEIKARLNERLKLERMAQSDLEIRMVGLEKDRRPYIERRNEMDAVMPEAEEEKLEALIRKLEDAQSKAGTEEGLNFQEWIYEEGNINNIFRFAVRKWPHQPFNEPLRELPSVFSDAFEE
ncbi:hypothetical protein T439DRAFT_371397 [Meredithblackwellia eburnea MCA 4105]